MNAILRLILAPLCGVLDALRSYPHPSSVPPRPPAGAGHPPTPLTACPICGETLICRDAALEWIE